MKRFLFVCLLAAGLSTLSACMFMGSDDKEFYGKGWMNPKELDKQPNTTMPMRPGDDSGTNSVVVRDRSSSGAASLNDGEWATPRPH